MDTELPCGVFDLSRIEGWCTMDFFRVMAIVLSLALVSSGDVALAIFEESHGSGYPYSQQTLSRLETIFNELGDQRAARTYRQRREESATR